MPRLPCVLYILDLGTQCDKNVDFSTIESGNSILKQVKENWSKHLNDDITFETVVVVGLLTVRFAQKQTNTNIIYQNLYIY